MLPNIRNKRTTKAKRRKPNQSAALQGYRMAFKRFLDKDQGSTGSSELRKRLGI